MSGSTKPDPQLSSTFELELRGYVSATEFTWELLKTSAGARPARNTCTSSLGGGPNSSICERLGSLSPLTPTAWHASCSEPAKDGRALGYPGMHAQVCSTSSGMVQQLQECCRYLASNLQSCHCIGWSHPKSSCLITVLRPLHMNQISKRMPRATKDLQRRWLEPLSLLEPQAEARSKT